MVPYDPAARGGHTLTRGAENAHRRYLQRLCSRTAAPNAPLRPPACLPQTTTLAELLSFSRAAVGEGALVESVALLAPRYPPLPPPAERDPDRLEFAVGLRIVGAALDLLRAAVRREDPAMGLVSPANQL